VKPASETDFCETDTATFAVSENADFFATISIKIDPSLTVKPLASQPISDKDIFTTLNKFVFYEKNPNLVKIRLPELAAVPQSAKVQVDF